MTETPGRARVPNYIEHTWLAYAYDDEIELDATQRALDRVGRHYGALYAEPLKRDASLGRRTGLVLWTREDERLRWPLWSSGDGVAAAYTSAPTGWGRILGEGALRGASLELGRRLRADPELLAELNPPFLMALREERPETMTIANDFIGAARLYGLETSGRHVWSNRLGALPIFAGVRPEVDERAWSVLAATGWFLGDETALRGARKVPGATTITVEPRHGRTEVVRTRAHAALGLVAPRDTDLGRSADVAAEQASALAAELDSMWSGSLAIDLSGGRDSRISAAGAVAAGITGVFQTVDLEPGEVDVARELLDRAPAPLEHVVRAAESPREDDSLHDRVSAYHLVHDGMLNPHSLIRGPLELPEAGFLPPIVSGHGGELGHAFYYGGPKKLRRAERKDVPALVTKLEKAARRKRDAATEAGFAAFREEVETALEDGRSRGLKGASLLDFYYLNQRLAHRSGLGARNDRASACATPGFVRACFDLEPEGRLAGRLHPMIVDRLVPEWSGVRIFEAPTGGPMKRSWLWERAGPAAEIESMLASEGSWDQAFDPRRVGEIWERIKAGGGRAHDERILMRLAWRVGFEQHLAALEGARTASA